MLLTAASLVRPPLSPPQVGVHTAAVWVCQKRPIYKNGLLLEGEPVIAEPIHWTVFLWDQEERAPSPAPHPASVLAIPNAGEVLVRHRDCTRGLSANPCRLRGSQVSDTAHSPAPITLKFRFSIEHQDKGTSEHGSYPPDKPTAAPLSTRKSRECCECFSENPHDKTCPASASAPRHSRAV